jgi:hypothetical protein
VLLTDAQRNCVGKQAELDGKRTLKLSKTKEFKLTVDYFFQKVSITNETIIMVLRSHIRHLNTNEMLK